MVTVADFKKELEPMNIKLIAGQDGLENVIEYLDVQEFPFKSPRVHKNSVILTTFYGFKNNDEIIEHFVWYAQVGISGICVHNVVYSEVPEVLIQLANKARIPLFYIPENIPYHILYEKYNYLIDLERSKLKNEIDQLNHSMLDALVTEKDNHFIIQLLGKYLNEYIIYLDKEMAIVSLWSPGEISRTHFRNNVNGALNIHREVFNHVRVKLKAVVVEENNSTLGKFKVLPLNSKMDFYGYLMISQQNIDVPFRDIIIKNTLTALILDAMKKNQTKEFHKNKDIKLLEEIFSDEKISQIKVEDFYFDIKNINYLLIIEPKNKSKLREYYSFIETKIGEVANNLVWIKDNRIIALMHNELKDDSILSKFEDIRSGISGKLKGLTAADLRTLYEQANVALHFSNIQSKYFCSWDELGSEKIIYFMRNSNLLKDYHLDYLQPLIDYDKRNNTNFTKTLYVYLSTFFSLKESGEHLHLHPNTVKYRVKKIEELLEIKIDDKEKYIDLLMALKFYFYYLEIEMRKKN
ncbi:CdaR family transcriptional regulator OS=Ureibacillus acetophenoni OX=614649 GN=SAMN05877842_11317 PE=3 SV=1 [Ureibacillus acetophenoni]